MLVLWLRERRKGIWVIERVLVLSLVMGVMHG